MLNPLSGQPAVAQQSQPAATAPVVQAAAVPTPAQPAVVVQPQPVVAAPPPEVSVGKSKADGDTEWLTPKQVADRLKVSEQEILDSLARGEFKAVKKIGPVWRISSKEVQ